MTSILLVVLVGGALIWMLFPRKLGSGSKRSYLGTSSNPGWWGSTWGGSGSTAHSSHSTDCSPGISDGGGGSCGGGGDGG